MPFVQRDYGDFYENTQGRAPGRAKRILLLLWLRHGVLDRPELDDHRLKLIRRLCAFWRERPEGERHAAERRRPGRRHEGHGGRRECQRVPRGSPFYHPTLIRSKKKIIFTIKHILSENPFADERQ